MQSCHRLVSKHADIKCINLNWLLCRTWHFILTLCMLGHVFFMSADFSALLFSKNMFRNITRVSNNLVSDQARHSNLVGHDLGLNYFQRLSADH